MEKIGYNQAVAEIEAILKRFDNEDFDLDTLAQQVKRATYLIKICQERLKKTENDVTQLLQEEK